MSSSHCVVRVKIYINLELEQTEDFDEKQDRVAFIELHRNHIELVTLKEDIPRAFREYEDIKLKVRDQCYTIHFYSYTVSDAEIENDEELNTEIDAVIDDANNSSDEYVDIRAVFQPSETIAKTRAEEKRLAELERLLKLEKEKMEADRKRVNAEKARVAALFKREREQKQIEFQEEMKATKYKYGNPCKAAREVYCRKENWLRENARFYQNNRDLLHRWVEEKKEADVEFYKLLEIENAAIAAVCKKYEKWL